jgi:hypothetical protein
LSASHAYAGGSVANTTSYRSFLEAYSGRSWKPKPSKF